MKNDNSLDFYDKADIQDLLPEVLLPPPPGEKNVQKSNVTENDGEDAEGGLDDEWNEEEAWYPSVA